MSSRWGNPTNQAVGKAVSALEGLEEGEGGSFLLSSGMAATTTSILSSMEPGDHLICPQSVYGGTHEFISNFGKRYNFKVSFVDSTDVENYARAIQPNTRLLWAETPCNPTMRLTDLKKLGELNLELQKKQPCDLIVDSTFASPYHQQPLSFPGVTAALHSATKYLGGHSDIVAGTVSSRDPEWTAKFGSSVKLLGCNLSPHDSFLLGRGIKSLSVRMERHQKNAMVIAEFLEKHPKIATVAYPGLANHPDHELARQQMRNGFGGMISFEVKGDVESTTRFVESLEIVSLAVSLGSVESLIEHPASMTHPMLPREVRLAGGITDGLVRFSVGIEDAQDLMNDLDQALSKA